MRKTWLLIILSILTIIALAACSDKDNENTNDDTEGNTNEAMPEADLDDLPDVVIEINGEEISKDEFSGIYQQQFQQQIMQAQMMGQAVDDLDQDELKKHTAEILIGQNLLIQEANERITDISEEDIDNTINQLLEQTQMESKEDLLAIFEEQGVDEEELMSQIETQVRVDQLVIEISKDIELTEEETKETYDMLKAQQEETDSETEFPEYEDIKSELEKQLKEQKKAEETEALVETLREKADITIHL